MLKPPRKYHHTKPAARLQRGVGLIEVLIAVLVLSIGLLGMAGLQVASMRNNQSAYQRGMAVVQGYYIADAMRADRTNARNGAFNIALGAASPTGTTFAQRSVANWRNSLDQAMGDGAEADGSVICSTGLLLDTLCDIEVTWNDSRGTGGNTDTGADGRQGIQLRVEL
jgi:type IV pilus assembly protein PilV